MATQAIVLPGEIVPQDVLPIPSKPSLPLKLGPGLRHVPPSTITPTLAGSLCTDQKKNAIWIENNNGRVSLPISASYCPNSIACKLTQIVHPPSQRPHHCHRPPLLHRHVPLLYNATHHICPATSIGLRRRNQKDQTATQFWQLDLRPRTIRLQAPRP